MDWERHIPEAHATAYAICQRNQHYMPWLEDAKQEATIALWRESARYDESVGTTLMQFARVRIAGAVWDMLRRVSAARRAWQPVVTTVPADAFVSEPEAGRWGRGGLPQRFGDFMEDKAPLQDTRLLTNELLQLCGRDSVACRRREALRRYYVEGHTLREVADDWGVAESRVSQILSAGEQAIRARIERKNRGSFLTLHGGRAAPSSNFAS